jgi:hypothetical protein
MNRLACMREIARSAHSESGHAQFGYVERLVVGSWIGRLDQMEARSGTMQADVKF